MNSADANRADRDGCWFKSSRSLGSNECVEVRMSAGLVGVRDSKNPEGPTLQPVVNWQPFVNMVLKWGSES